MEIVEQINEDFKEAMKARASHRVKTLKMLKSELQNKAIETGDELTGEEAMQVLSKQAKQRKDSIEQYEEGGRKDLAAAEREELEIINEYLPEPLSDDELGKIVDEVIEETGASEMSDMGKVMGTVIPKVRGKIEGEKVQEMVRQKLS